MDKEDIIALSVQFLEGIGLPVRFQTLDASAFLEGVTIRDGAIVIDRTLLRQPGDILHEAGHLAVVPSIFRHLIVDDVDGSLAPHYDRYFAQHPDAFTSYPEDPIARGILQSGESEAIAWSYTAALAAGIPPASVFHEGGYGDTPDSARHLLAKLSALQHVGIHGLAAGGMCLLPRRGGFPSMLRWLQI